MKKFVCLLSCLTMAVVAEAISLADARAQIGDCIADSAKMTSVMKQVPAAEQAALLAEVNEAISKMRGSNEAKVAAYLNANKAALRGAAKGNVATLLAEVYATVAPEALPIISESIATDLMSRTADPTKTYSDEQFTRIAETVMKSVNERMASVENGAARAAFAISMLVQASGGTPADLTDKLVSTLPVASQEAARKEWFPAASGENKNYDPMLGAADAQTAAPAPVVVLRLAGPQVIDALLADITSGTGILEDVGAREFATSATETVDTMLWYPLEPVGYQGQY